jgi:hypothetical protein
VDVLSIVLGAGTLLGGGGTAFLWHETRSTVAKDRRAEEVKIALGPLHTSIQSLQQEHQHSTAALQHLTDTLQPLHDEVISLRTKMQPFWKFIETLAIENIGIVHKPHPENAEFDGLLERYRAFVKGEGPRLPLTDELRLREFLHKVKDWVPGKAIGLYVEPGDPTSATIILATMELYRAR